MGLLELKAWATATIAAGPQLDTEIPIRKMTDFELAMAIQYRIDQIRQCENNIRTLEIWPEHRSELFNETLIYLDGDLHCEELSKLREEFERRVVQ